MLERTVSVKHLPTKDSFIYIPASLNFLSSGTCVRLTYHANDTGYFSLNGVSVNLPQDCIGLSSLYAKALGLEENESVVLLEMSQLPTINSITISPISKNDYQILEMLADNIQGTLLNQLRVVYAGQVFVIWIGNNINVSVVVDEVNPVSPGILGFLTEVHIKEKSERIVKPGNSMKTPQSVEFSIENFLPKMFNDDTKQNKNFQKYFNYKQDLVYRIIPIENLSFREKLGNHNKIFNVFLSKKFLSHQWPQRSSILFPIYCSMTLLTDDVFSCKKLYVRLIVLEDIETFDFVLYNDLCVSSTIFYYFYCDTGARVVLKYLDKVPFVGEISVHTRKNLLVNVKETFRKFLADHSDDILVLNPNIAIDLGGNIVCSLKLSPVESEFVVVDDHFVRNYKCSVYDEDVRLEGDKNIKLNDNTNYLKGISNYPVIIQEVLENFQRHRSVFENVLITGEYEGSSSQLEFLRSRLFVKGKPGTGKSAMLKVIAENLQAYPNFLFVKSINCKNVKGKTADSLQRFFSNVFGELVLHQPSVLILDDLHVLCENIQGDESAPNSIYFNRISEMLHNFFKLLPVSNCIGICSTAVSTQKLNKNMYTSRGSHLYKIVLATNELSKNDRQDLLKHMFRNYNTAEIDFEDLCVKTEGFVIQDVVDFCDKTLFEAFKEEDGDENSIKITQNYCDRALKNTCVLSLENVNLHSPGNKDFSDIGGLSGVKNVLIESLLWPAKYPNIFSEAPLRLQSGLLLYGPPGTGKTLLAAAAAKHCGLRLISVKGPELLSKYIGASEQAVRDIFEKAQSVRPCILFFDEFDSLAPRRGHDNTGVTDRVVNQLLTQLDGVESLTGVCVLAASSRPDLLDPALLRPGRLDKQLMCPLPDKVSRLDILKVLSKNLDFDVDVNLEKIADSAEFYSGADLQSLLYTAHVSTIDDSLEVDETMNLKSKLTQKHLEQALTKTKPSLTKQERLKYERIYTKFQKGSSTEDFRAGTKATLA